MARRQTRRRREDFRHPKYDLIGVRWLDHCGPGDGYRPVSEIDATLEPMHTVGWLVRETRDTLVVAPSCNNRDSWNDETVIGKKLITDRRVLLRAKRK